MAYNYEYPGVNMNDYNNDWILKKMTELILEWKSFNNKWEDVVEEFDNLKKYVEKYFESLDVSVEVGEKLEEMYNDGRLALLISQFGEVSITRHIFPNLNKNVYYSGQCSLVKSYGKTIVIDAGAPQNWTAIKECFDKNVDNIDIIIISHYHFDHVGCLENILSIYPHNNCTLYCALNPTGYYTREDLSALQERYNDVISLCNQYQIDRIEVDTMRTISYTTNDVAQFSLLNSTPVDYDFYLQSNSVYNNYSMMVEFKIGETYSLYPGDIQKLAQERQFLNLHQCQLYCAHHHGIESEDYIPYLNSITPSYLVLSTSASRLNITNRSSYVGNFYGDNTVKLSTAFSEIEVDTYLSGSSLIKGTPFSSVGEIYAYIDYYIDNSVDAMGDGSSWESPFNSITSALMHVSSGYNKVYTLHIKGGGGVYPATYIRERDVKLVLTGVDNPVIESLYLESNSAIELYNLELRGNLPRTNSNACLTILSSKSVYISSCTMALSDNIGGSDNKNVIFLDRSEIYITASTLDGGDGNNARAIACTRYGKVVTNNIEFRNVTYCYQESPGFEIVIRGVDVVPNSYIIGTSFAGGYAKIDTAITQAIYNNIQKNSASALLDVVSVRDPFDSSKNMTVYGVGGKLFILPRQEYVANT